MDKIYIFSLPKNRLVLWLRFTANNYLLNSDDVFVRYRKNILKLIQRFGDL